MLEVYSAVLLFFIAIAVTIRAGLYLPAFYALCYMLPFLPLLAAPFGMSSVFWTGDRFIFDPGSNQIGGLTQVWLISSLGVIGGFALSSIRFPWSRRRQSVASSPYCELSQAVLRWPRVLVVFAGSSGLVLFRFLMGGDIEAGGIFGLELIVCLMLLLCWMFVLFGRRAVHFVLAALLTATYVWSQIRTGDRDFFLIFIALMLFFVARRSKGSGAVVAVGAAGFLVPLIGATISMIRMDITLSIENLFEFMAFNSWNATILPVILMIENEWDSGVLLYGKTYLDLLLSVGPSPLFSLFGLEKPIQIDNPASWFYIDGLGGMHAAGVALRNFGLAGVFLQSLIFVYFLSRLERRCCATGRFWASYLYVCVAGVLMHTIWYSLISMINALVLFISLYCLLAIRFTRPAPRAIRRDLFFPTGIK